MPINQEGSVAFQNGICAQQVPYTDRERRIQWLTGWYVSKRDAETILAAAGLRSRVD